ncbi:primosomal replication protein N [Inhella gelatinilytica]|uniref:Primosomal replication protein N n=1 Tax=Inhella gelatinilytica TaxID=2795030 RepID=A0A931NEM5_9BURK|nr:primosomal replication protein N [Inhella gelatinilytica]MBH9553385.1 primosomal replication protein N [Inhella gelatinilytica]
MTLSARWVERAALRYTPAGMPALDLVLEHLGQTAEAGLLRKIELRVRAVALGPLARELQTVPADTQHLWSGFLAPARNGKGVVMHITGIQTVTPTNP